MRRPAAAEHNPYTPREVCGSNYRIIDRERHRDEGIHLGTTFLMWNGGTGRNCVVTIKYHGVGRPNYVGGERRGLSRIAVGPCQAVPGVRRRVESGGPPCRLHESRARTYEGPLGEWPLVLMPVRLAVPSRSER